MKRQKAIIAIIGATGRMGSAIARSLAKSDYRLLLFGRNNTKLEALSKSLISSGGNVGIDRSECQVDASWEADIIILAVPFALEKEIAGCIKEVSTQKIVISISNPFNESFDGLVTPENSSAGEEIQRILPDSKIVKAFNTVFASQLGNTNTKTYLAGNDEDALATVAEIAKEAGLEPVITGSIVESRKLEAMALEKVKEKMVNSG